MLKGSYDRHRKNQREWILEVAEDLFIKKGIQNITINDITKAARLTRPTIYKYFSSKEDIATEIFKSVTMGWVERNKTEVWNFEGNGLQRIEKFIESHFGYLFENLKEAGFIAEFNYLYAKEWPVEKFMKLILGNLEGERKKVFECIKLGQSDGSLRTDIDPELMLAAILNFNSGMTGRLGEMGVKLEIEYNLSAGKILTNIYRLFLDGLRPQKPEA